MRITASPMKALRHFVFATTAFALSANVQSIAKELPSRLVNPTSPGQNLIIENTSITTREFWDAYTSNAPETRRRAELFLLGVLDATEGASWCDYRRYKTITIDESLYSQLQKMIEKEKDARAAKLIVQILAKSFPCGGKP